jgi:hypothetical protein
LKRRLDLDRAANASSRLANSASTLSPAVFAIRDPTSMPGDKLVDKGTMRGQRRHRRFFIAVHQAPVALDIRSSSPCIRRL